MNRLIKRFQFKSSVTNCSKVTMSLVNVLLKLCKSYSHFFRENICELDIVFTRIVNISTTNELVNDALNNWAQVIKKTCSDVRFFCVEVFLLSQPSGAMLWYDFCNVG